MATLYPSVSLAGLNLNDPSGRWDLLNTSDTLPILPERTVSKIEVPGAIGETVSAWMPQKAVTYQLKMRFNAIDEKTWKYPSTIAAQHKAIRDNITHFLHGIGYARNGILGQIQLRFASASNDWRYCNGFIAAASTPEWSDYNDYAEMTLIFENTDGVLYNGYTTVATASLKANARSTIWLPTGSAPTTRTIVAFKGPFSWNGKSGARCAVTNTTQLGFRVGLVGGSTFSVASNEWLIVNARTGKAGLVTGSNSDGTQPAKWTGATHAGWVLSIGRPMGSVLHVVPGTGAYGKGAIHIRRPNAGRVAVKTRPAFY